MKSKARVFIKQACAALFILYATLSGAAGQEVPSAPAGSGPLTQSIEEQTPARIFVMGEELLPEISPMARNSILYIPAGRNAAAILGAAFSASSDTGALSITLKTIKREVVLTENQTRYEVDGLPGELPEAPFVESGYLMVPAREFFEAFGFYTAWDRDSNTMNVTVAAPAALSAPGMFDMVFSVPFVEPAVAGATRTPEIKPEMPPIEYTYDNTMSFENTAISGASGQSNLLGTSALRNQFNLRARGALENGYAFRATLRTLQSTNKIEKKGEVDKLAMEFEKGGVRLNAYDFAPKFSYFTMKNYQLQGLQYERRYEDFSWTALLGKSPKKLADSEYARYARGFRAHRAKTKDRDLGFSYVNIKDRGSYRATAIVDNTVFTVNTAGTYGDSVKFDAEYAWSKTALDNGPGASGAAGSFRAQYRDRQTLCTAVFEKTAQAFNSETTYVTSGRREASALCNMKPNGRTVAGWGYKAVLLGGEETRTLPLFYSVAPFKDRPAMKLSARRNFERTFGSSSFRSLDMRALGFSDEIGSVSVDLNFERRKQKDPGGAVSFRNAHRYRFDTFITDDTEIALQIKRERRSRGANPITRFYQIRVDHELVEWNQVYFALSRYYNGTINNRSDFTIGYQKIDIMNDTELDLEYRFFNYRDHNDNVIQVSYSFFR